MRHRFVIEMNKGHLPNLILTASGPGEISGWVQPLLQEIRRQEKPWAVSLVLWKTAFTTGSERRVKALVPQLDALLMLSSNLRDLWKNPTILRMGKTGVPRALLHLGGDPLFTRFLAMRLKCPAFMYSERGFSWHAFCFRRIFLSERAPFDADSMGVNAKGRFQRVGDLFVDAVAGEGRKTDSRKDVSTEKRVTIGLFPGSRPYQIQYMGPLFLILARRIAKKVPNVEFLFAKSEYLSHQRFVRLVWGGKYEQDPSNYKRSKTCPIPILSSKDVFAASDMAVMLPGTGTAEGMILGLPMVVLAPYYRLGSNPSPGVPPIVDTVLGMLGTCTKRKVLISVLNRFTFFSHPNIRAAQEIVPELRGWIRPWQIVETVAEMARNETWRNRITTQLRDLAGSPGAARRIVEALNPFMG
jgi:hypothetical protein